MSCRFLPLLRALDRVDDFVYFYRLGYSLRAAWRLSGSVL